MSSYVVNSFYKRVHDSYDMHTFGNYSSLSGLQQSNYCHGGQDLSGNTAEQASCNSLKREDMNASLSVRTSTPPEPPPLKHGVEGAMEVTTKPSGEKRGNEIREENVRNQQNCSFQNSNSKQPQIYPWMTKLHMSHGKVYLKITWFRDSKMSIILNPSPHFCACFTPSFLLQLPTAGQTQEIIKLLLVNFMTKPFIARKPVLLLWRGDLWSNLCW